MKKIVVLLAVLLLSVGTLFANVYIYMNTDFESRGARYCLYFEETGETVRLTENMGTKKVNGVTISNIDGDECWEIDFSSPDCPYKYNKTFICDYVYEETLDYVRAIVDLSKTRNEKVNFYITSFDLWGYDFFKEMTANKNVSSYYFLGYFDPKDDIVKYKVPFSIGNIGKNIKIIWYYDVLSFTKKGDLQVDKNPPEVEINFEDPATKIVWLN